MIDLYVSDAQTPLGSIAEDDLQTLVDALEEESKDDQDYYINAETIDLLANRQASEGLLALLRQALGTAEGVDIRWERR